MQALASSKEWFAFGVWMLDPVEGTLTRGYRSLRPDVAAAAGDTGRIAADGAGVQQIRLPPLTCQILATLVEHGGKVVTRARLRRLGGFTASADASRLDAPVAALCDLLGVRSDGAGPCIERVGARGYRFAEAVLRFSAPPPAAGAPAPVRSDLSHGTGHDTRALNPLGPARGASKRRGVRGALPAGAAQRYEFLSLLGAGGMGEVYLARDRQLDRQVALKLLAHQYTDDADWLRRFEREAKAASVLNHPNIITIHDIGETEGVHYIATEYIEGRTLRLAMVSGPMGVLAALKLVTQVAAALVAAHAAGIVHRDVKPENIMVRPDGWVKLLDFGLAKPSSVDALSRQSRHTDPGMVVGTTHYMSPEQARGQHVDARSDVFSLGVLLYEMLSGRPPFTGPTSSDVLVAILERAPPPLAAVLGDPPPAELERILAKALRKDREQRYQTMRDLQLDLSSLTQELELRARLAESVWPREIYADAAGAAARPLAAASEPAPHTANSAAGGHSGGTATAAVPEVRYTQSGQVNIAYQVLGDAPLDLVFVMGWVSHLEYFWTDPSFARFLRRLATFARVILFDKRGTGLSDRVPLDQLPTLEQRMDDVRAVMDAVGSQRAVLCGVSEGGPMCSLFAATHPEKTIALVMIGSYARRLRAPDYPWGPDEAQRDAFLDVIRTQWGGPVGIEDRAPGMAHDPAFRTWWAAYLRHGASPAAAVALTRMNSEIDIRPVLPTIRVPTLVVHRRGDRCLKVDEGRFLAQHIPGAKYVELPGADHLPFVGPQDEILDEIEEFLTGMRHASAPDRVLATVLVVQLVSDDPASPDSSATLARHQLLFRNEVELFKGRVVRMARELLVCTFDGPARAIRAASAVRSAARRLFLKARAGLHTGECDVRGDSVEGPAVTIASQIAAASTDGEVLVSSTVKDLVAGSGLSFRARGSLTLEPALGEWRLFAV